jgi:NRAMP (natural resistance-associated macrophage protein)-like metal ion transporter
MEDRPAKRWWQKVGPGIVTGAADDDPSGIVTYTQAGAQLGYGSLWMAPLMVPLMVIAQERCGRIGLVTGRGLASNIRRIAPMLVLPVAVLLLGANIVNIAADIGAMAAVAGGLIKVPFAAAAASFALLILTLEIVLSYRVYVRYLKWMTLVLLVYPVTVLLVKHDWLAVWHGTVTPLLGTSSGALLTLVAIIGTTISPYLFFWQASEEVEEEVLAGKDTVAKRRRATKAEIADMRRDTVVGMAYSNVVMWAVIATAAATLGAAGISTVASAQDAAMALAPLGGPYAFLLFSLGIIGVGFMAIPVLAGSAAYALAECFRWREGLNKTFNQAPAFYGIIIFAVGLGLVITLLGVNPIRLLYYAAVINGIVSVPLLAIIVRLASSKSVMGDHATTRGETFRGWLLVSLVTAAVLLLFASVLGWLR